MRFNDANSASEGTTRFAVAHGRATLFVLFCFYPDVEELQAKVRPDQLKRIGAGVLDGDADGPRRGPGSDARQRRARADRLGAVERVETLPGRSVERPPVRALSDTNVMTRTCTRPPKQHTAQLQLVVAPEGVQPC